MTTPLVFAPSAGIVPCARRLSRTTWCGAEDGHAGDCTGVTSAELGVTDFGPKAAVNTRRSKL